MKIKKKYIAIGLVAAVCAAAYAFLPGAKEVTKAGIKATKTTAAHYDLIDSVDASAVRQVITADSTTSRTIMWQSAYSEDGAVVEYRKAGSDDMYSLKATNDAFDDDQATYIHSTTITDLEAGTTYEYRVGYDQKRSDWMTFTTAAGGSDFKALIFPDSQSNDYSVWADTAQSAWRANGDAQFFINMGDLVDNGQDSYQWNAWFEAAEPLVTRIPVAPVMGNHETYTKDWKVRMPEAYLHLFSLPENGLKAYQNQFYSFDYGDVHFAVLNTQIHELADFEAALDTDQLDWLRKDLSATNKKWKVILMHKDPLQYAFNNRPERREEGFSQEGETWMPIFDEYGVDVVLSAHLHTYRDRGHIRDFKRDATGPLYILTGVAGNVRYPNLWRDHQLDTYVAPQPETDNYLTLKATADSLTLQAYLPDGTLLDSATVEK